MAVTLRVAAPEDAAAIRACAEEAYAPYMPLMGRRPAPMDADFEDQIAAGQIHLAVSPNLLGYVTFFEAGGAMLLESVAVFRHAAGQGIGKALIAHCEEAARAAGLSTVQLYTNAAMTQNSALYQHLGYRETDRRVEAGFHRIFFAKVLRPSAD